MAGRMSVALSGLAVGMLGLTANATPGPQQKPSVQWAKTWKEAVEEAKARNVPIFISFHMDN